MAAQNNAEDLQARHGQNEERAGVEFNGHPAAGERQREKRAKHSAGTWGDAEQRTVGRLRE